MSEGSAISKRILLVIIYEGRSGLGLLAAHGTVLREEEKHFARLGGEQQTGRKREQIARFLDSARKGGGDL